ncbi:MAG TPA: SDR family NAD(P)-dependent oxidoreductase, partial [Flavisolibacter sp.]|nr:SDR family NAD(P)-dependent oxidoreductase [Flavisolibacter sp.]
MKVTNNKILITGGGSGIGLGLTERFLAEKNTVVVCGRRAEVLQQLSDRHPSVITKVCDVSDENERIDLFNWIKDNHPDLNVLVNNAGIQQWMNVTDEHFYEKAKQEIRINVEAPL